MAQKPTRLTVSVRVAIVEDHEEFREGLYHLLQGTVGFRCLGKYRSLEESLGKMPEVDVVLLDIGLPGMSGTEGIALIKAKYPSVRIVMLTVFEDDKNIFRSILHGADGYILKRTPPPMLLEAITEAAEGGAPMTSSVARKALEVFKRYLPEPGEEFNLSHREAEILSLIVSGLDNDEIAEKLFISPVTVRNHIAHIYAKLHVHSKSQAVAKALKQGRL